MTTLITGGTGRTGSALARLLHAANQPILIATRTGVAPAPFKAVKFDWSDPSTFLNPFETENVTRIYIVAPSAIDNLVEVVKSFIDIAISKGVKRFVLLSASVFPRGGAITGQIHDYLATNAAEYSVLRPTWFMQNFQLNFYESIRERNEVFSTAKDGRLPFVSTEDIAQAAFDKLTEESSSNADFFLVGPELYTYDQATELLSEILGRKIVHKRVTEAEAVAIWTTFGLPETFARALTGIESKTVNGTEELLNEPNAIIGKKTLREFFTENRSTWIKE